MNETVMKGLWAIIAGDSAIKADLSTYIPEGGSPVPAVFDNLAPRGAVMPYLIMNTYSNPEETPATDRMILTLDYYDQSGSSLRARRVNQRLEKLFNHTTPVIAGITILGAMRDGSRMVPEDDDEIQHLNSQFIIRYGRNDLY